MLNILPIPILPPHSPLSTSKVKLHPKIGRPYVKRRSEAPSRIPQLLVQKDPEMPAQELLHQLGARDVGVKKEFRVRRDGQEG